MSKLDVGDFRQTISIEIKVSEEEAEKIHREIENRINEPNFKKELTNVIIDFYKKYEDSVSRPLPEGEEGDPDIDDACEPYVETVYLCDISNALFDSDSKAIHINITVRVDNISYEWDGEYYPQTLESPAEYPMQLAYFPFPNLGPSASYDVDDIKRQIIDVFGPYKFSYMEMYDYAEVK